MKTKIAIIEDINKDIGLLEEASSVIKNGGIVAFPTETVYGLGANALDSEAVKKIFIAKGRPQDNPLIIHVANKDISHLVNNIPKVAEECIKRFWPGPLTIILEKKDIVPEETSAGLKTIGIRMPSCDIALKLIELSGKPIAAPSANISGKPSPTEVERCIEDLEGRVDYIVGGKRSEVGVESTIIDCTVIPPLILRPGGITIDMLREVCEDVKIDEALMSKPDNDLKPKAPGMKYRHYAPKGKMKIIKGDNEKTIEIINEMVQNYIENNFKVAVITTDENIHKFNGGKVISLGASKDLTQIARNLFETLRVCDDLGMEYILCQGFYEEGVGLAIMNRLTKAAGYDIIDIN